MNEVLNRIIEGIHEAAEEKAGFLDMLFGPRKPEALAGTPVILFGAGVIGGELSFSLRNCGIDPVCFCDNDDSMSGSLYRDTPVISFDTLKKEHKDSLVVIATRAYSPEIADQLLTAGFRRDRIIENQFDIGMSSYITYASQLSIMAFRKYGDYNDIINILRSNEDSVARAYELLIDQKSKDIYISRMVLMALHDNIRLLGEFIMAFSDAVRQFGLIPPKGASPENYLYYNNDIMSISKGEILVDVGAFDGDTVETFVQTCIKNGVSYGQIYAFEPDPKSYRLLLENTSKYANVSCHELGLWSGRKKVRFDSPDQATEKSRAISDVGDTEIELVSLDDFLGGREVTFLKVDPGGDIIPHAIIGASRTIGQFKPKLAIGVYHSVEAIFELPLLVKSICPEYKMYLRHHSWTINETDLLAYV